MLALIPLFPFLGFLVNSTMGRRLPKAVSGGVASLAMLASFAVAATQVWQLASMAWGLVPSWEKAPETKYSTQSRSASTPRTVPG